MGVFHFGGQHYDQLMVREIRCVFGAAGGGQKKTKKPTT
jgi:hypothetical protein